MHFYGPTPTQKLTAEQREAARKTIAISTVIFATIGTIPGGIKGGYECINTFTDGFANNTNAYVAALKGVGVGIGWFVAGAAAGALVGFTLGGLKANCNLIFNNAPGTSSRAVATSPALSAAAVPLLDPEAQAPVTSK